jgi:hypothetical protein
MCFGVHNGVFIEGGDGGFNPSSENLQTSNF